MHILSGHASTIVLGKGSIFMISGFLFYFNFHKFLAQCHASHIRASNGRCLTYMLASSPCPFCSPTHGFLLSMLLASCTHWLDDLKSKVAFSEADLWRLSHFRVSCRSHTVRYDIMSSDLFRGWGTRGPPLWKIPNIKFLFVNVVSEANRSSLRCRNFKFPRGACPQIPLL